MGKLYDELVQKLSNMSEEDKAKIWAELEPYNQIGPTVDEYINAVRNEKANIIQYFKQYLSETTSEQLIKDWDYIREYPQLTYEELLKKEYLEYINENNPTILKTYINLLCHVDNYEVRH